MKTSNKDLVGTEINGLKITNYAGTGRRQFFDCICICRRLFRARVDSIKAGTTKSCGCLTGDLISRKNRLPDNQGALNLVLRHYTGNAKKRKLKFDLSLDNFRKLVFDKCYYCGIEPRPSTFTTSQENRRDKEICYNGVDRIDNSIGYTISNCVTCCSVCNGAKSDLSFEDFKNWIKRLVSFNNGK